MLTTKPIDRRARIEEAEETVEAKVVSTSPGAHGRSREGKGGPERARTTKGKDAKGREP
jgi:hypothetical protein